MSIAKGKNKRDSAIAVFGSAFNPPHNGHIDVVLQALEHVEQVILVPSYCHAFDKPMAPYEERVKMVEAMASSLKEVGDVRVSDVERALSKNKRSGQAIYTFDVLCILQAENPNASLMFLLGPDNAEPVTWSKFYKAQEILNRWNILKASERVAVRSTGVRKKLARGELPTVHECPAFIIDQLKTNKYYRNGE